MAQLHAQVKTKSDNEDLGLPVKSDTFALQQHKIGGQIMATYTININERTKEGRSIVDYLREKGLIPTPQPDNGKEATRRALEELGEGKVTRCKTFDDYLESVR